MICIYHLPLNVNIHTFYIYSQFNVLYILLIHSYYKSIVIIGNINIDIKPDSLNSITQFCLTILAYCGFLLEHSEPIRGNNNLDHLILRTKYKTITIIYNSPITDPFPSLLCVAIHSTKPTSPITSRQTITHFMN